MKYTLFFCNFILSATLVLFISSVGSAQLLDTIGALGVGGQLANQGVKSTAQGLSMLQQNNIINNINMLALDIKINSINGYTGLNKGEMQSPNPFGKLQYDIGSFEGNTFFIELKGVDENTCRRLISTISGTKNILVNGADSKNATCSNGSQIKFIYE